MSREQNRVAAIQMATGPNVSANLLEVERLVGEAVENGAGLVVLPENFAFMGKQDRDLCALREADHDGPLQEFLSQLARRHGIWLVGGTIPLEAHDNSRVRAACIVYDDQGRRVARYDKIHLFDVNLIEANERYVESETIEAGDQVVVVDSPFGKLGIAVCYDLRFPELFRAMGEVDLIVLPAAFTYTTGQAHWEVLLRARAIENQCYVLASAQGGRHPWGRRTWGDSLVIDPWGEVLDRLPEGPGVVSAPMERARIEQVRSRLPALAHRRFV